MYHKIIWCMVPEIWSKTCIFKTTNIGIFKVGNSQKIYQKQKISMSCTSQNLMNQKNTNLIFTLPSKLLILIIDHTESCFFSNPPLPTFSSWQHTKDFGPAQTRKQSAGTRTCFSFKIKDQNNLIWVGRHTKNNLRLFKLDSKTLLACHTAMTSTKWGNIKATPTLTLLEDISIKIIGRGFLQSYIWLVT